MRSIFPRRVNVVSYAVLHHTCRFFLPFFFASGSVLYSKFLYHVEPYCSVEYQSSIAALKKTLRGEASRFLELFFVRWTFYLSFQWVTRQRKNAKNIAKTSSSYFNIERFPCRFVDEYQRLSIDVCTIGNSDKNLA